MDPGESAFDIESVLECARETLSIRAQKILEKACVLELNVARVRGRLKGVNGTERFRSFIHLLRSRNYRAAFFHEYPVLFDVLTRQLDFVCTNTVQMLTHWMHDRAHIIETLFDGHDPGALLGWDTGLGDSHCGGRMVMALRLANGDRIIYKPRSLKADIGFARLLAWCNTQLPEQPLRAARTLDRGDHGWFSPSGTVTGAAPTLVVRPNLTHA